MVNDNNNLVGGIPTPLKMMEFVTWDDDIPNWMEIHKIHVPNHQPVFVMGYDGDIMIYIVWYIKHIVEVFAYIGLT